jgi:NAD(P)-dependent dehydrogenase (short-subunit alcohol dehydrogenase family)
MDKQTAVVTGANRGIGLELCRQLKAAGAEVIATARDPESATELQALSPARIEALDVADPASVAAFADALGDTAVDLLINNAGIGGPGAGIANLDIDEIARTLNVNSLGPLRVTQALLPNLLRGRRRIVAHISSNMGSIANNDQGGYYGYRASKTALNSFNRSLAHELRGRGFTCVVLHPGWVQTGMGGESAPLTPEASVGGLMRVLARLSPKHNGRFFDHTGAELPW